MIKSLSVLLAAVAFNVNATEYGHIPVEGVGKIVLTSYDCPKVPNIETFKYGFLVYGTKENTEDIEQLCWGASEGIVFGALLNGDTFKFPFDSIVFEFPHKDGKNTM